MLNFAVHKLYDGEWRKLLNKNLSQLKRQRQNEKRRLRNRAFRSSLRSNMRSAREAIAKDVASDDTKTKVTDANSTIDRMVTKGLIHRNTAARYKSRMMGRYNAVLREAGVIAPPPAAAPEAEEPA